ncbi:hypothetical protein DENSPDRAFT_930628 [Dentipellis sp. KUC8613]|nr:hypothetical protein DENSPDRAFT_930628 [Dentipellis sp. KUC8613]
MDSKTVLLVVSLVCLAVFIIVRYVFTPRTDHPWILLMVLLGFSAPIYHVYGYARATYAAFWPILDTPALVCTCFVLLALVGSVVGCWVDRRRRVELQALPTSFRPSSQPRTWAQAQSHFPAAPSYPAPPPKRYQASAVNAAISQYHGYVPSPPSPSRSTAYNVDSAVSTPSGPTYGTFSGITTPTTHIVPTSKGSRSVSTPQPPTQLPAPALQIRKPLARIQPLLEVERDGVLEVSGERKGTVLRKRADEAWDVLQKTRKKAREVRELGHREEARRQDKLADVQKAQMDKFNKAAAEAIFRENNKGKGRSASEIDLHGLFVPEALEYTQRSIKKAKQQGMSSLKLIVGKGNHSKNGEARIKPAVQKMLKEENISYKVDPRNTGLLIVTFAAVI